MANSVLNQLSDDKPVTTVHKMDSDTPRTQSTYSISKSMMILLGVVIFGSTVGFGFSKIVNSGDKGNKEMNENTQGEKKDVAGKAGINDKTKFKDNATGILKEGGIEGEGDFHLERPGGESQNVYLTSTTVDLNEYIGKKITVWGETYSAEKAGWLMDAGYIEVVK